MQSLDPADILSAAFDPNRQNSAAAAAEEEEGRVEIYIFRDNDGIADEAFCKSCLDTVSPIVQSHLWHRGR
jgi:hypothetical protein